MNGIKFTGTIDDQKRRVMELREISEEHGIDWPKWMADPMFAVEVSYQQEHYLDDDEWRTMEEIAQQRALEKMVNFGVRYGTNKLN